MLYWNIVLFSIPTETFRHVLNKIISSTISFLMLQAFPEYVHPLPVLTPFIYWWLSTWYVQPKLLSHYQALKPTFTWTRMPENLTGFWHSASRTKMVLLILTSTGPFWGNQNIKHVLTHFFYQAWSWGLWGVIWWIGCSSLKILLLDILHPNEKRREGNKRQWQLSSLSSTILHSWPHFQKVVCFSYCRFKKEHFCFHFNRRGWSKGLGLSQINKVDDLKAKMAWWCNVIFIKMIGLIGGDLESFREAF